jgi:hypothetical protein
MNAVVPSAKEMDPSALMSWEPSAPALDAAGMFPVQLKVPSGSVVALQTETLVGLASPV